MDSGHFFLSSDSKNFGQITKHSLHDVTDLKHGVFLPVKTEGCDSRPKHCHCHRHCSINNNILLWSIMSWLSQTVQHWPMAATYKQFFLPKYSKIFTIRSFIILIIIYSGWETLWDSVSYVPPTFHSADCQGCCWHHPPTCLHLIKLAHQSGQLVGGKAILALLPLEIPSHRFSDMPGNRGDVTISGYHD